MISTVTRLSTDGTTRSIPPLDPYFRKFGNALLGCDLDHTEHLFQHQQNRNPITQLIAG